MQNVYTHACIPPKFKYVKAGELGGWEVWLSNCLHDGRTIQFTLHLLLFCLVSVFHSLCARQYWSTFPAAAEQEALFSLFLGKPLLHPWPPKMSIIQDSISSRQEMNGLADLMCFQ